MSCLQDEGSQDNAAEGGVPVDSFEDVPLTVDFAGVNLIEELHHDEDIEDDGVVFRGRRVKGGIATTVNAEELLSYGKSILFRSIWLCLRMHLCKKGKCHPETQYIGQCVYSKIFKLSRCVPC